MTEKAASGTTGTSLRQKMLDRMRIAGLAEATQARLVVLDPLVRLHGVDENAVAEVAPILGFLRDIQRRFGAAVLLVHHARKSAAARPGQALRGSSELHAWGDSNLYLRRRDKQIVMTVEHRAAPGLNDIEIELVDHGKGARAAPPQGGIPQIMCETTATMAGNAGRGGPRQGRQAPHDRNMSRRRKNSAGNWLQGEILYSGASAAMFFMVLASFSLGFAIRGLEFFDGEADTRWSVALRGVDDRALILPSAGGGRRSGGRAEAVSARDVAGADRGAAGAVPGAPVPGRHSWSKRCSAQCEFRFNRRENPESMLSDLISRSPERDA